MHVKNNDRGNCKMLKSKIEKINQKGNELFFGDAILIVMD